MELQQTFEVTDPNEIAVLYRDGDVVRHRNVHGLLFEENSMPMILGELPTPEGGGNVSTYLTSVETIDANGEVDGMILLDMSVVRGVRRGSAVRLIEKKEDGTYVEAPAIDLFH